jgi:hypothetical protein
LRSQCRQASNINHYVVDADGGESPAGRIGLLRDGPAANFRKNLDTILNCWIASSGPFDEQLHRLDWRDVSALAAGVKEKTIGQAQRCENIYLAR